MSQKNLDKNWTKFRQKLRKSPQNLKWLTSGLAQYLTKQIYFVCTLPVLYSSIWDNETHCRCKSQIREQMCLETHFRYEFSFLGNFGQSGLQRKYPNCHKYATFEASFFMSSWAKNIYSKKKIPQRPHWKVTWYEAIKNDNFFIKKWLEIKNRLPVEFQNSM